MKQLPDKFSVYAKTLEEAKYITEKQKELCGDCSPKHRNVYYRFSIYREIDKFGFSSQSYLSYNIIYEITQEFTFEEFKSYFEEQTIPDFKIKGTKLPLINENIQFTVSRWNSFEITNMTNCFWNDSRFCYSHGYTVRDNITYILLERIDYEGNNFFMFKEEDLIRLYKKQNNIEDMELISIKKLKLDQEYIVYLETKEEWEILNKLVNGKGLCIFCKGECHSLYNGTHSHRSSRTNPGSYTHNDKPSKIITIYQIKEYQDMKNKQIIGYKLSETKFLKAAVAIEGFQETGFSNIENRVFTLKEHQESINRWKKADVLNSWFTPVYETKEEIISINGQFNLKVKDKRVYHNGTEDITDYVKSMGEWYENIPKKFGKYDFTIENIILSKTGCQYNESHISQWLKVYNLIK